VACEFYVLWPIGIKPEDKGSRMFRRFAPYYQTTRRHSWSPLGEPQIPEDKGSRMFRRFAPYYQTTRRHSWSPL